MVKATAGPSASVYRLGQRQQRYPIPERPFGAECPDVECGTSDGPYASTLPLESNMDNHDLGVVMKGLVDISVVVKGQSFPRDNSAREGRGSRCLAFNG
jgi:hypothetical protein